MHHSDPSDFLESLPIPCIYLTLEWRIAYINAAARKLIHPVNAVNGFEDCLLSDTGFADTHTLSNAFDQLNEGLKQDSTSTGVFVQRRAQWLWTLSQTEVNAQTFLCLTAQHEASNDVLLSSVISPSFDDVDHAVTMATTDLSTKLVNDHGRKEFAEIAQGIQYAEAAPLYARWSDDFTRRLPGSESVAATAFRLGKGIVSIRRGIEDPKTGIRTVVDSTVTLLNHPSGEPLGCVVQMRPQQEWAQYLQRYDVNNRPRAAMVRTLTLQGKLDFFCQASEAYFQSTRNELCATWQDYVHAEDLPRVQQAIKACLATGRDEEFEVRYRQGTTYRYFSDRIAPYRDENGVITRWYCISTDIHLLVLQRRQADMARDRLTSLMRDMDVNLFEVDQNYVFRYVEGEMVVDSSDGGEIAVHDIGGASLESTLESLAFDDSIIIRKGFTDVMEGRSGKSIIEYTIGEKHMQTILVPMGGDAALAGGTATASGVFGITIDVSAQFKHKQTAIQLEAMAASSRLKDEFVANVSHELRTPIAGLNGLLELLLETDLTEEQLDLAHNLEASAKALSRIVNDILDFSKAEANAMTIEMESFDLCEVLHELKRSHVAVAEKKKLKLETRLPNTSVKVIGDALRLRQIVDNLLSNAIKFTEIGHVHFITTYEVTNNRILTRITVEDTGPGVDQETLARLFQPFAQADQSTTRLYGGTGLGLSIARKLARAMGGDVTLTSVKGSGATSTLTLPFELAIAPLEADEASKQFEQTSYAPPTEVIESTTTTMMTTTTTTSSVPTTIVIPFPALMQQASDGAPQEKIALNMCNIRILVVEDNAVNLKVISGHLRKLGIAKVSSACNGLEAVDYVGSTKDLPDLIFMDCQMPIMDGFESTRRLRSYLLFSNPIIALTASATPGYRQKCLDAGMSDYVTKPFTRKQLHECITKWFENNNESSQLSNQIVAPP